MSERIQHRLSEAEFFDWLRDQERRHELVDGEPVMMAGAGRRHDRVVVNLIGMLYGQLRGKPCVPNSADTAVRIPNGNIRFPDVTIDCGRPDDASILAADPTVVIEVLSPSSRAFDREDKLDEYKRVATIMHVLLIDPDEPEARLYTRTAKQAWDIGHISGLDQTVALAAVGVSLTMADIYETLTFKPRPRLVLLEE